LYYVVPVKDGFASLGLTNKYNAPATILNEEWKPKSIAITLYEGGLFKAYSNKKPSKIMVNGKQVTNYTYNNKELAINIGKQKKPVVRIYW
jgi:hypothetical protein